MTTIQFEGALQRFQSRMFQQKPGPAQPQLTYRYAGALSNRNPVGLTALQAKSLRTVMFSGARFQTAPHVQLQTTFMEELKQAQEPDEKAAVAEMLGRAKLIQTIPALLGVLAQNEPVVVRLAAINALAEIGDATHPNSFTRGQVGRALIEYYKRQKQGTNQEGPLKEIEDTSDNGDKQLKLQELEVLLRAIGRLRVAEGLSLLKKEYEQSFVTVKQSNQLAEDLVQEVRSRQHHPLEESNKNEAGGEDLSFSIEQAVQRFRVLQNQHETSTHVLMGALEGLAQLENRHLRPYLSRGLQANHPLIKAKALVLLGAKNELKYATDIYPNLMHRHPIVRQAALQALVYSKESAAEQKLMELLNPQAFLGQVLSVSSPEGTKQYLQFLLQLAQAGDRLIKPLQKTANSQDLDVTTRKMALFLLKLMTQKPLREKLPPATVVAAQQTLKRNALRPDGQSLEEKQEIGLMATKLWVSQREPDAIGVAMQWLNKPLPVKAQEDLLIAVFEALHEEKATPASQSDSLTYAILNTLESLEPAVADKATIANLRQMLRPSFRDKLDRALAQNGFYDEYSREILNDRLINQVRPKLEQYRPVLLRMLGHEVSTTNRMLAARVLGTLRDQNKDTVNRLIENTRDPLKGMVDWSQEPSFRGSPSIRAANIRFNNIMALGDIGDGAALGVMLDALDDPTLRPGVLMPLASIAPDVNRINNVKSLARLQARLLQVMATPDTSSTARVMRIQAANALYQFRGGVEAIKQFINTVPDPNFKRHALAALVMNDYATDPSHADHALVRPLLQPELGVERLHQAGVTGKGVEMAIIDGGYVDRDNTEAFQDRVKLPAAALGAEDYHPTMVASTAAANGKIKGVAPDALIFSDKWPDLDSNDPMDTYKKIIEGKLRGENNVRVINNSWGLVDNNVIIYKDVRDILKEFKKVVGLAEKAGIQIVFSAGNEGRGLGFPSLGTLSVFGLDVDKLTSAQQKDLNYILNKVILVGAANTQGLEDTNKHLLADFSSLGDSLNNKLVPTVVAPGVDIMVYSHDEGLRPKELVNGTSFSGPYVSGLIALMMQAKPDLKPSQIRSILTSTAIKLPGLSETYQGAGEVDPHAAVTKAAAYRSRRKP